MEGGLRFISPPGSLAPAARAVGDRVARLGECVGRQLGKHAHELSAGSCVDDLVLQICFGMGRATFWRKRKKYDL
jgi:hypothetical protein